ncbi:MAG: hypothetical protein F6K00_03800 [Leptolyngbya sp. SIOISBB]|nr:hypothetical protein [Leptolyngbya sp. SIOISBB]
MYFLAEYAQLKAEQAARIGFRDNLLYVTLGVFGAVVSFAVSDVANVYAFLVVPWVSLILGWTYLVNDQKISALGEYIRHDLVERVKAQTGYPDVEAIFGWEIDHRTDLRRRRRKLQQLVIDEITFVGSGIVAIGAFWLSASQPPLAVTLLGVGELLLLLFLGYEMWAYADLASGR